MSSDQQIFDKCIHQEDCVLRNIEARDVVEDILGKRKMEVFLCKFVKYHICTPSGVEILAGDLSGLRRKRFGYCINDPITGMPFELKRENFKFICTASDACTCEEYVRIWEKAPKQETEEI